MHDLVLQYLRFEIKSDKDSLALATFRQARFMATSEVLCASLTGEKDICGGRLPLIASWSSLRKLDAKLNVKDFYLESLAGMTDKRFWHQAGSVLRFLVSKRLLRASRFDIVREMCTAPVFWNAEGDAFFVATTAPRRVNTRPQRKCIRKSSPSPNKKASNRRS